MEHWQVEFSADETAQMLAAAHWNAKNPFLPFEADSQAKRESVSPQFRALTKLWLDGVYQQLELRRQANGFAESLQAV